MKTIKVELNQFKGNLATRDEYLMSRSKHLDKIEMKCTWESLLEWEPESRWLAMFPISVEVIVVRFYTDNRRWNLSIQKIQNGKTIDIYKDAYYYEWASEEETDKIFEEFENQIEFFKKRGFQVMKPQ